MHLLLVASVLLQGESTNEALLWVAVPVVMLTYPIARAGKSTVAGPVVKDAPELNQS